MKKWIALLVCFSATLSLPAQTLPFPIESMPDTGIILDQNWKWHAGDNSERSKPSFDDSKWDIIDPTKDIKSPKELADHRVFWLRLAFHVSPPLENKVLALSIKQTGSTQFFFNGKLLGQFGHY